MSLWCEKPLPVRWKNIGPPHSPACPIRLLIGSISCHFCLECDVKDPLSVLEMDGRFLYYHHHHYHHPSLHSHKWAERGRKAQLINHGQSQDHYYGNSSAVEINKIITCNGLSIIIIEINHLRQCFKCKLGNDWN